MTKSTITREQLIKKAQEQIEFCRHTKITGEGRAHVNQCAALFEIALAALDSEPVAYMYDGEDGTEYNGHNEFSGGGKGIALYRHAQPAPVVPEEKLIPNTLSMYAVDAVAAIAEVKGWNACRAAMLQAEPVTTDNKLADDFDFDRFNDVTWLECVASNPHMHSPTTSTIARVALELNKRIGAGNSPAQSDCCPAQNSVNPAQGGNSLVIPDEMTSGQAYEIGYYYGDPVDVFARGANWMRQHIIDSTLAAAPQEVKGE